MRRLLLLALVVPLASGCGHTTSAVHPHVTTVPEPPDPVPRWVKVEHLPNRAIRGAELFHTAGCNVCHTYAGSGTKNLGAPDLTAIGTRHLGVRFQINHLKCPSCVNPGSPMPPFASLGAARLRQVAVFLEASKGTH
jgi:Cytochrome c